jgi:ATP-binding cassette subfamily F protein 3
VRVREERKAAGEDLGVRPRRRAGAAVAAAGGAATAVEPPKRRAAAPAGPSKNRLRDQEKAERAVEAAEAALVALEQELSDPAAWATKYETAKNEARHTAAKRAVEAAYAELEAVL